MCFTSLTAAAVFCVRSCLDGVLTSTNGFAIVVSLTVRAILLTGNAKRRVRCIAFTTGHTIKINENALDNFWTALKDVGTDTE
jgi:hypothetical protein